MSRAHSLPTKSRCEGGLLDALIDEELDACKAEHSNCSLHGPELALAPKPALALSLAIHELAINAVKYGALSVPAGRVDISWQYDDSNRVELLWRESGGPTVSPPKHRGFGSTLIERALALETEGHSKLAYDPDGVTRAITLPVSAVQRVGADNIAVSAHVEPEKRSAAPAADRRILVVEDSALVPMLIEDVITQVGWEVVGPALRLSDAVVLAKQEAIDAALLDVHLDGEISWDAADILRERAIPFSFTTGYDSATILPERFANCAVVSKPFQAEEIEVALERLLR